MKMNYLDVMKKICKNYDLEMTSYYDETYCEKQHVLAMCRVVLTNDDVNLVTIDSIENNLAAVSFCNDNMDECHIIKYGYENLSI